MSSILDVDLLAFESGTAKQRAAVVDGVRTSLRTGFVYTSHDLSSDLLDTAYGMLTEFFSLPQEEKQKATVPGSNGQAGYTGLLVETAASSDTPDWKEMINWGQELADGHPLQQRYPHRYLGPDLPEEQVPASPGFCSSSKTVSLICSAGSFGSSPSGSAATRRFSTG